MCHDEILMVHDSGLMVIIVHRNTLIVNRKE